jgi:hypothetical protein
VTGNSFASMKIALEIAVKVAGVNRPYVIQLSTTRSLSGTCIVHIKLTPCTIVCQ